MEISLQQTIHTNKTSAQPQKTIHPQTFWIVHKSLSRPRRGQTPLNRRRSERGERNLRQVETTPTVPEGGEYQSVVRPLRGRYYLRIHTASSASPHMRFADEPQKTANGNTKDGKRRCKRPSFKLRKTAFCNTLTTNALQKHSQYGHKLMEK